MARKMDDTDKIATLAFLVDTMDDNSVTDAEWDEAINALRTGTLPF